MAPDPQLHPQYVTDSDGQRKGVILPVEEFEELLEDLDDLAVAAERRETPTIPHEEAKACLRDRQERIGRRARLPRGSSDQR